ncbi:unnamed protein product [Rotaria socialis]|uniref:molybdopterin molybdotransferase n=2 Tax=Rotaria TaxID=231623 RepID=A0A817TCV0_9BILA|nr:unnamed protein product [Rotaria socialis]CAF3455276.1 unnamed protein product [Rotaria socialis]CAF3677665.1 unnamed protein product [Rotaria socialis]
MQQEHISKLDTNLLASSFDEEHVETLLKLCDELQPNLILTTGGTGIDSDDMTREVCGELSYYKENLWPNTDNGCEVISNCSYGYAVEVLYRDTDDDIQMSEFALQKNVPLGLADLGLLATVEPQTIHVYDKLCVVVLSTDNREIRDSNKIMFMRVLKCTTYYLLSVWHYL